MNIVDFKKNGLISADTVYHFSQFKSVGLLFITESGKSYFYKIGLTSKVPSATIGNDLGEDLTSCVTKYICPNSEKCRIKKELELLNVKSIKGKGYEDPLEVYVLGDKGSFRIEKSPSHQLASYPNSSPINKSQNPTPNENEDYKILVVDDSKTIRKILTTAINNMDGFTVVAETGVPEETKKLIRRHQPDAMTLDLHMPNMTGVEVLKDLGSEVIPTIVVSSISLAEGDMVIQALEMGAFDYLHKPTLENSHEMFDSLNTKLELAVLQKGRAIEKERRTTKASGSLNLKKPVFIGASTGGTEALKDVLLSLPKEIPPILIVQHIPPFYSKSLANRLNELCPFRVKEAEDEDTVEPGTVLIAPGGFQMEYSPSRGGTVKIFEGPNVSGHKPSVDVLFKSAAKHLKNKCIAVILTGMGKDGAQGMKELFDLGVFTIAQDEETCVVYGMPKSAVALNGVSKICPLPKIGQALIDENQPNKRSKAAS